MQICVSIFHLSQPAAFFARVCKAATQARYPLSVHHTSPFIENCKPPLFALISRCRELHPAAEISRKSWCTVVALFRNTRRVHGMKSIAVGVPHPSLTEFSSSGCCWSRSARGDENCVACTQSCLPDWLSLRAKTISQLFCNVALLAFAFASPAHALQPAIIYCCLVCACSREGDLATGAHLMTHIAHSLTPNLSKAPLQLSACQTGKSPVYIFSAA